MGAKIPNNLQGIAVAEILSLCTDQEVTQYAINALSKSGFHSSRINPFIELLDAQLENQDSFERRIQKGRISPLPPTDPIESSQQIYQRKMDANNPLENVSMALVVDADANALLGCRYLVGKQSLDSWCQERGLNAQDYINGLQSYLEGALLSEIGVGVVNGRFVLNSTEGNSRVLSFDELGKILQENEVKLRTHIENSMKQNKVLSDQSNVEFGVEKFGQAKVEKVRPTTPESINNPAPE